MKISDLTICKSTAEHLWNENEPDPNSFVIARESFTKRKSIKEQRRAVIDRLNEKACNKIDKNKKHFFDDSHVIILWDNLPRDGFYRKSLGYSERHLLRTVCLFLRNRKDSFLFIEKPTTLCSSDDNYMEVLDILFFIWKTSGLVPYFIEKDFLTVAKKEEELTDEYMQKHDSFDGIILSDGYEEDDFMRLETLKKQWVEEGRKKFIASKNEDYFIRFFSSIESLISIKGDDTEPEPPECFLDIYFSYRAGKIRTEDGIQCFCKESRATWYRYIKAFEESPLYESYSGFFQNNIDVKNCSVEDSIELLAFFHSLLPYYENPTVPYNGVFTIIYEKFDFIHAINDVWNHLERATKTVSVAKHKAPTEFRTLLLEHNLTEDDLSLF